MKNGLYAVQFAVGPNQGAGVLTFWDGMISGGDGGFAYFGQIDQNGEDLKGTVEISQHSVGMDNVFAGLTNFTLKIEGRETHNDTASFRGSTKAAPGVPLNVAMRLLRAF